MPENGKPSLMEAISSVTRKDLTDLDKAIAGKTEAIEVLQNERSALSRMRSYAAHLLGIEPKKSGAKGVPGSGSLYAKIENLIQHRGPMGTAEIATELGRKEGGVRLAIRKAHYRFCIVDSNKIGLVGSEPVEDK